MIELTHEQVQALGNAEVTPPRVMNPQTREMFVLVPLVEYERPHRRTQVRRRSLDRRGEEPAARGSLPDA